MTEPNLRFAVKILAFLRFPAPSKCLNFQEKRRICENQRFSAKICVLGSLCHLRSLAQKTGFLGWVHANGCMISESTVPTKIGCNFLLAIGSLQRSFYLQCWSFFACSGKARLICTSKDCKQRSLTISKKARTVSRKLPRMIT